MTYLAVPIQGENIAECQQQLKTAGQLGAELVELRTDYLSDPSCDSIAELIRYGHQCSLPVLVTCRDKAQGGAGSRTSQQRTEVLVSAVKYEADFIDCEYNNFLLADVRSAIEAQLKNYPHCRLILSAHNFNKPFDDINILYESILAAFPQAIPKLVFTANHISDCFIAFDLLHQKDKDAIVFCMGSAGMISRVLARKFDSFLTFASLDDEHATAPGQLTIRQMKDVFGWDRISQHTEVFGLIGDPVGHSMGPYVYNMCFAKDGINAVYLPFHVQQERTGFNLFMQGVLARPWLNFSGFSVTIPHKTNALDFARQQGGYVEPLAATIGAVNTLKIGFNNILTVYNTDYAGAMDALTVTLGMDKHMLHNVKVAVIGAGGAARAVVAGLTDAGSDITIYNRTLNKALLLAKEFQCKACGLEELDGLDASILINCTSIGMTPNVEASPVPAHLFNKNMTAFDTVYTPLHTRFLQDAQAAGAKIVNGAEMYIRQAMVQYRIFLGREADEATMRQIVFDRLGRK